MSKTWSSAKVDKADLIDVCLECEQPATGSFDSGEDGENDTFFLECVNCHTKYKCTMDVVEIMMEKI